MRKVDYSRYIGKSSGHWTVIAVIRKPRRVYFECVCKCRRVKNILVENYISGLSTRCRACSGMHGDSNPAWRGHGEIPRSVYTTMLRGAADRGIDVAVTMEQLHESWIECGGKCALTGLDIILSTKNAGKTASIDRIDSSLGYTKDNIQWVHKDVNIMRNRFSIDYFVSMCIAVARKMK